MLVNEEPFASRYNTISVCDRQTDRQTESMQQYRARLSSD